MKRRSVKAALGLIYTGETNRYVSKLLWSPWTELEGVDGEQEEEETVEQKERRLAVFPESIFPVSAFEDSTILM